MIWKLCNAEVQHQAGDVSSFSICSDTNHGGRLNAWCHMHSYNNHTVTHVQKDMHTNIDITAITKTDLIITTYKYVMHTCDKFMR